MSEDELTGSVKPVAWVTGSGAARVGRTIALHFAARGYRIVLHANKSIEAAEACAKELRATGTEVLVLRGAVEDVSFAKESVDAIVRTFGQLDVLVNSAAIWEWKPLEQTTAADVQQQFSVNTLGTFLASQAAGLQMVRQPQGGSILLIGDWAVAQPYPDFAAYFVGKGAIETMTRSLAVELATRNPNIRVNAIMPGTVLLDPSIGDERAKQIVENSLLKRLGRPEDIAQAAYFLATQEFITGQCLCVDGGRSIYTRQSIDANAHPTYP